MSDLISRRIVRRFDDFGRILIPKEIRIQLFGTKCTEGELMEILVDGENIILRKYKENTSDDVCKWKWEQSHGQWNGNPQCKGDTVLFDSIRLFTYCPYCGKKIKVVDK